MKIKFLTGPALALVILSQVNIASAQTEQSKPGTPTSVNVMTSESGSGSETTMSFTEDGHRYKLKLKGEKITEFFIDGKEVPESDYPKYDGLIKKILIQIEKDRKQAELDRAQAEKDRQRAAIDREQAEADRKQADKDREQSAKDRVQAEKDREQADKDRKQAEKDRGQAEKDREQANKDRKQAEKDREQAEVDRKHAEEDRKLMDEMLTEIVNDKLVENRNALTSLVLDANELVVNGTKQPDTVHRKFKTKYLKTNKQRINYQTSGNFRGISII